MIPPLEIHPGAEWLIKKAESYRGEAYLCPTGHWTIGWGHTHGVLEGHSCTEAEAEGYFRQDYGAGVSRIAFAVTVPLTRAMTGALVSLIFNIGTTAFGDGPGPLRDSTLLTRLNAGEYQLAAAEFKRWNKGRHPKTGQLVVIGGLSIRRAAEARLFLLDGLPV